MLHHLSSSQDVRAVNLYFLDTMHFSMYTKCGGHRVLKCSSLDIRKGGTESMINLMQFYAIAEIITSLVTRIWMSQDKYLPSMTISRALKP